MIRAIRIPLMLSCGLIGLSLACCSSKASFSSDPEAAIHEIEKIVPVGTTEQDAATRLKSIGLECSLIESEGAVNHLLVGTQKRGALTWRFGLSIADGKVDRHSVTISGLSTNKQQANPDIPESWYQSWLEKPWHSNPKIVAEFQLNSGESKSFKIQSATKLEIGFIVKDYTKADGDRLVYLQSPDGSKRVGGLPGTSATFTPADGTISVVIENRNPTNTRVVLYHEDVEPADAAQPATNPATICSIAQRPAG